MGLHNVGLDWEERNQVTGGIGFERKGTNLVWEEKENGTEFEYTCMVLVGEKWDCIGEEKEK